MKRTPSVIILIPNYNSASIMYRNKPILLSCLQSLKKTKYNNYKILIADNSSTDNSREIAKRFNGVKFQVKKTREEYGGIPRTNNFGIRYIMRHYNPDYILMYNTDMLVNDALWLKKLVDLAESDEKIGLVGCKLLYPTGKIQHAGIKINYFPVNMGRGELDKGQYDKIEEADGVTAALVLIKNTVIKKVDLFDEKFYNGFDDTDFCIRVRKAGFKIMYDGKASIIHFEGFASANSPDPAVRDKSFYGHHVAYMYFAFKNFQTLDIVRAIFSSLVRSILVYSVDDTKTKKATIKVRDRALWRLGVAIKSIFDGYGLYKTQSNRK